MFKTISSLINLKCYETAIISVCKNSDFEVILYAPNSNYFQKLPLLLRPRNTYRSFATNANAEELEKRRKELMARGLPKVKPIPGVKYIIMIASGKGGVGKSTTAVNLAASLKSLQPDKNVGLLDADVFGPSIPLMMNLHDTPLLTKDNLMQPLTNYGIKCMSMGFLIAEGAPVIWRGLMVMQALEKLMRQVDWGIVDYLVVDTPPGTGDTHLSLVQNIPISGAILVTTSQSAAIQVTKRGAVMFQRLKVPIIGIVENMSSMKCPSCSVDINLFGTGTSAFATEIGTTILQQIPIQQEITTSSDKGVPIVVAKPESEEAITYKNIAEKVIKFVNR